MKNQKQQELADTEFFARAGEEIRQMRQDSIDAQSTARKLKKIAASRQQPKRPDKGEAHYMNNLIIDYLRAKNYNFTYSVFMKEVDILSSEVLPKAQLVSFFSLAEYNSQAAFNISAIELILEKLGTLATQKTFSEYGIQIQLLKSDNTANNVLLSQMQASSIRSEIEQRQKKHYENLLANMKKLLTTTLKQDLKKDYQLKLKDTKSEYERQVNTLKQKNKEFLINNPKINPKVQEYLRKIEDLQTKNMNLSINLKELQRQKITHNCFKAPKIVQKEKEVNDLKKELLKKRQEYEFALKTIHTSIHSQAAIQQKVNEPQKQTDLFLENLKNRKNTKDFMIDEMYGRTLVMDRRIENLSKDNEALRELNRQLTSKLSQLEELNLQLKGRVAQTQKFQEKIKIIGVKPVSKNIGVAVTPQEFKQSKKQNVIDEFEEVSNSQSDEQAINRKISLRMQVKNLHSEMQIYKNKLRYFVQDFQ